jgi:hypothetical protein
MSEEDSVFTKHDTVLEKKVFVCMCACTHNSDFCRSIFV